MLTSRVLLTKNKKKVSLYCLEAIRMYVGVFKINWLNIFLWDIHTIILLTALKQIAS